MRIAVILMTLALTGCGLVQRILPGPAETGAAESALMTPGADAVRPQARPDGQAPSAEPAAPVAAGGLGVTVASLGDPAQPGLWMKTPLVRAERAGQVRYGGQVVAVTLIPLDADPGAGSQLSLQAMRSLGAPLTELVEVSVEAF
jgi:hypothetical protein